MYDDREPSYCSYKQFVDDHSLIFSLEELCIWFEAQSLRENRRIWTEYWPILKYKLQLPCSLGLLSVTVHLCIVNRDQKPFQSSLPCRPTWQMRAWIWHHYSGVLSASLLGRPLRSLKSRRVSSDIRGSALMRLAFVGVVPSFCLMLMITISVFRFHFECVEWFCFKVNWYHYRVYILYVGDWGFWYQA
jgi:hypothetical protein